MNKQIVTSLYKRLLRYGKQLVLTDSDYFCQLVRQEFLRHKEVSEAKRAQLIKKGEEVLRLRRFR